MYPNGLQSQFTYDDLNRITAMNAAKASYSYTLGPTGNRTGAVESSGRTLNWTYDGIYRLTNETISLDPHSVNGSVGYGLDPVGNRQSQTSSIPGIGTGSFTYDPDDRLNTETYDANGNTLTTAGKTFAYDFENRLKSMNNGAVTIQYDADGNRVAKTVAGVTTRYLVDELNPTGLAQVVEEVTGTTASRFYTYGLQRISENQQISNAWTPSFYGYDGGGTVRLLTDSAGTVTDTYDYDAWGNEVDTTGSTPNAFVYRGEEYDPDLGFYYLRARYLDMAAGRFLSVDPEAGVVTDPLSLHRYLYANGDPVDRVDPSGRAPGGPPAQAGTGGGDVVEYAALAQLSLQVFSALQKANTIVSMVEDIHCIWNIGGSYLKLGVWVAEDLITPIGVTVSRKECEVKPIEGSCGDQYADYPTCASLEGGPFRFGNPRQAKNSLSWQYGIDKKSPANSCKNGGTHFRIHDRGRFVDSILCCNCCDDRGGAPTVKDATGGDLQRCALGRDLHGSNAQ